MKDHKERPEVVVSGTSAQEHERQNAAITSAVTGNYTTPKASAALGVKARALKFPGGNIASNPGKEAGELLGEKLMNRVGRGVRHNLEIKNLTDEPDVAKLMDLLLSTDFNRFMAGVDAVFAHMNQLATALEKMAFLAFVNEVLADMERSPYEPSLETIKWGDASVDSADSSLGKKRAEVVCWLRHCLKTLFPTKIPEHTFHRAAFFKVLNDQKREQAPRATYEYLMPAKDLPEFSYKFADLERTGCMDSTFMSDLRKKLQEAFEAEKGELFNSEAGRFLNQERDLCVVLNAFASTQGILSPQQRAAVFVLAKALLKVPDPKTVEAQ